MEVDGLEFDLQCSTFDLKTTGQKPGRLGANLS